MVKRIPTSSSPAGTIHLSPAPWRWVKWAKYSKSRRDDPVLTHIFSPVVVVSTTADFFRLLKKSAVVETTTTGLKMCVRTGSSLRDFEYFAHFTQRQGAGLRWIVPAGLELVGIR